MRKEIIQPATPEQKSSQTRWLDLEKLARVEISSEDPAHPIESALTASTGSNAGAGPGWRASQPGPQTIRLIFDAPQRLRQVCLEFVENEVARTQEFVLRWSADQGRNYREIVRQQYNFSPPDTSREREEYPVDLSGVTTLELNLDPAIGRSEVRATLARLLLA